jgi:hypothetical protein
MADLSGPTPGAPALLFEYGSGILNFLLVP